MTVKDLYAPNGKLIKGTAETVQGIAKIGAWERRNDGTIEITDWAGETDIDWNTQTTERDDNGEMLFVDEDGGLWPGSVLVEGDKPKLTAEAAGYTATLCIDDSVKIAKGGVWVGEGWWGGKRIYDCTADLGEDVYGALDAAIAAALQP